MTITEEMVEAATQPPVPIVVKDPIGATAINIAIGGSFLAYVMYQRQELKRELDTIRGDGASTTLYELNSKIYKSNKKRFVMTLVPSIMDGLLMGMAESKRLSTDREWLSAVSIRYAESLMDKIHDTSSQALMEGFVGQINRNVIARTAAERVINAFGITPRTMRALINMWTQKPREFNSVTQERPSKIKDKIDKKIADEITRRANLIGDNEEVVVKNMGKAILWNYDAKQGNLSETARVVWYTKKDERVCKYCGPMHGKFRKPDQPWRLPDGKKVWGPGIHIQCRCEQILVPEVTREVLRMTLEQAEQLEETRELVSKAFVTRDGKYDERNRASNGRFARTEQRSRTLEKPKEVTFTDMVKPQTQTGPVSLSGGVSLQGATISRQSPVSIAPPVSVSAPSQSVTRTPASLQAASLENQTVSLNKPVSLEPTAASLHKPVSLKQESVAINPIGVALESMSVSIADTDMQQIVETATKVSTETETDTWAKTDEPYLAMSGPRYLAEMGESFQVAEEFMPASKAMETITRDLHDYWTETLDYGALSYEVVADALSAGPRIMGNEIAGIVFNMPDGKDIEITREQYEELMWNAIQEDGRMQLIKNIRVFDESDPDGKNDTFVDMSVGDLMSGTELDEVLAEETPIVYTASHMNIEDQTEGSTAGAVINGGRWMPVQTTEYVLHGDFSLPYVAVDLVPEEIYNDMEQGFDLFADDVDLDYDEDGWG